jgi:hypothetical protein
MLYQFINNKNQYITGIVEEIDKEIDKKETSIEDIEDEFISSVKELRAIYINAIQEKFRTQHH